MPDSSAAEPASRPTQVFVVSPIGSAGTPTHTKAKKALEYIIRKALPAPDWEVRRADEDQAPDSITQKVVGRIINADLVVVDITDHNPNVFYELAIAHCYKRPVVIIAEAGTHSPFDITDQTRIDYDLSDPESVYGSQERLVSAAQIALARPDSLSTPLSMHDAVTRSAERLESGDTSEFADVLERILGRLDAMEASARRTEVQTRIQRLSRWVSEGADGPEDGVWRLTDPDQQGGMKIYTKSDVDRLKRKQALRDGQEKARPSDEDEVHE